MKASKKKKLEAAGWKVGSAAEFLELSEADEMIVNIKLSLADKVRDLRRQAGLTQEGLARLIGSSQSRVAKMETGCGETSIDLLVRSLAVLGASPAQIGEAVEAKHSRTKKSSGRNS